MPEIEDIEYSRVLEEEPPLPSFPSSRTRTPTPERELDRLFSIYRAAQRRQEMEALRGGPAIDVSGYRNDFDGLNFEKTVADKLTDEVINRQLQTDIRRGGPSYVKAAKRELLIAQRRRERKYASTAWVNASGRSDFPRTVFGTEAWISKRYFPKTSARGYAPKFLSRGLALPCVERSVRREVLIAKKRNKGHRVKHRRLPFTDIWC